jgi:hypothetical protein
MTGVELKSVEFEDDRPKNVWTTKDKNLTSDSLPFKNFEAIKIEIEKQEKIADDSDQILAEQRKGTRNWIPYTTFWAAVAGLPAIVALFIAYVWWRSKGGCIRRISDVTRNRIINALVNSQKKEEEPMEMKSKPKAPVTKQEEPMEIKPTPKEPVIKQEQEAPMENDSRSHGQPDDKNNEINIKFEKKVNQQEIDNTSVYPTQELALQIKVENSDIKKEADDELLKYLRNKT